MTRASIIECLNRFEEGMCKTKFERKDWRDNLLWYLCWAMSEILKEKLKEKKDG